MAATAVVEVEAGPAKGLRLTVTGSSPVDVGRDKAIPGCLRDQTISRKHGTFSVSKAGNLEYTDSSRNGTWFVKFGDKQPTATLKETTQVMQPGDALLLGHTCLRVKSVDAVAGAVYGSTASAAAAAGEEAFSTPAAPPIDDSKAKQVYDHPFTRIFRAASAGKALFLAATADHDQHA